MPVFQITNLITPLPGYKAVVCHFLMLVAFVDSSLDSIIGKRQRGLKLPSCLDVASIADHQ